MVVLVTFQGNRYILPMGSNFYHDIVVIILFIISIQKVASPPVPQKSDTLGFLSSSEC